MSTYLASYSFRVHPKRRPDEFIPFKDVGPHGLRQALFAFFENLVARLDRDDDALSMLGAKNVSHEPPAIFGQLKSGAFDTDAELYDIDSQQVAFHRTRQHAQMMLYYFQLYMPDDASKGIMITERHGIYGRHTALVKALEAYLSTVYNLSLVVSEVVPQSLYKELKDGIIETVTFSNVKMPKIEADRINWKPEEVDEVADIKLVVRVKKGRQLPISDLLTGRLSMALEKRIEIDGSDLEPVEVRVNYNRTQRTVKLHKPSRIAPLVDISAEVDNPGGQPSFESVHRVTETFIQQLIVEMGSLK